MKSAFPTGKRLGYSVRKFIAIEELLPYSALSRKHYLHASSVVWHMGPCRKNVANPLGKKDSRNSYMSYSYPANLILTTQLVNY
jgi:hypothetical protein